jgi:hypothetical protein
MGKKKRKECFMSEKAKTATGVLLLVAALAISLLISSGRSFSNESQQKNIQIKKGAKIAVEANCPQEFVDVNYSIETYPVDGFHVEYPEHSNFGAKKYHVSYSNELGKPVENVYFSSGSSDSADCVPFPKLSSEDANLFPGLKKRVGIVADSSLQDPNKLYLDSLIAEHFGIADQEDEFATNPDMPRVVEIPLKHVNIFRDINDLTVPPYCGKIGYARVIKYPADAWAEDILGKDSYYVEIHLLEDMHPVLGDENTCHWRHHHEHAPR